MKQLGLNYAVQLLEMCKDEHNKKAIQAMRALVSEMLNHLLPKTKLHLFYQRMQGISENEKFTDIELRNFYFEHELKQVYMKLIELLK